MEILAKKKPFMNGTLEKELEKMSEGNMELQKNLSKKSGIDAIKKRICQCYKCNTKWHRQEGDDKKHCPNCKSWDWYWIIDRKKSEFARGIKEAGN